MYCCQEQWQWWPSPYPHTTRIGLENEGTTTFLKMVPGHVILLIIVVVVIINNVTTFSITKTIREKKHPTKLVLIVENQQRRTSTRIQKQTNNLEICTKTITCHVPLLFLVGAPNGCGWTLRLHFPSTWWISCSLTG